MLANDLSSPTMLATIGIAVAVVAGISWKLGAAGRRTRTRLRRLGVAGPEVALCTVADIFMAVAAVCATATFVLTAGKSTVSDLAFFTGILLIAIATPQLSTMYLRRLEHAEDVAALRLPSKRYLEKQRQLFELIQVARQMDRSVG